MSRRKLHSIGQQKLPEGSTNGGDWRDRKGEKPVPLCRRMEKYDGLVPSFVRLMPLRRLTLLSSPKVGGDGGEEGEVPHQTRHDGLMRKAMPAIGGPEVALSAHCLPFSQAN